jgi:hypothetical protein
VESVAIADEFIMAKETGINGSGRRLVTALEENLIRLMEQR